MVWKIFILHAQGHTKYFVHNIDYYGCKYLEMYFQLRITLCFILLYFSAVCNACVPYGQQHRVVSKEWNIFISIRCNILLNSIIDRKYKLNI